MNLYNREKRLKMQNDIFFVESFIFEYHYEHKSMLNMHQAFVYLIFILDIVLKVHVI